MPPLHTAHHPTYKYFFQKLSHLLLRSPSIKSCSIQCHASLCATSSPTSKIELICPSCFTLSSLIILHSAKWGINKFPLLISLHKTQPSLPSPLKKKCNLPSINPRILSLDLQHGLGLLCVNDKVVVAMGAVLVVLVPVGGVLAEALFALFARKRHFGALQELVTFRLGMALSTVKPFFTW